MATATKKDLEARAEQAGVATGPDKAATEENLEQAGVSTEKQTAQKFSEKNTPSDPETWPEYQVGGRVRAIRVAQPFTFAGETHQDGYLIRDPDGSVRAQDRKTFEVGAVYVG